MTASAEFATVAAEWERAEALKAKAAELYPRSAYLQAEWLRKLDQVRNTTNGWVYDRFVTRKEMSNAQ